MRTVLLVIGALGLGIGACSSGSDSMMSGSGTPDASVDGAPPPARPTITRFEVTPATLPYGGGTVTVTWSATDATSVELQGQSVTGTSVERAVTSSTTFELRARGPGGEATATTAVTVATTITVDSRVIDQGGTPRPNVTVTIKGRSDTVFTTFSTGDDGKSRPFPGIEPPYTFCLHLELLIACYVGLTRVDPTLTLWPDTPRPGIAMSVSGTLRRADSAPLDRLTVRAMIDGPGDGNGAPNDDAITPSYTVTLRAPPLVVPEARVWAVFLEGENAAFGQTGPLTLIPGERVTAPEITLSPTTTTPIETVLEGPYPSLAMIASVGLLFPQGGALRPNQLALGTPRLPVIPGTRMFATGTAFDLATRQPLSTVTVVGDVTGRPVVLAVPPAPLVESPPAGSPLPVGTEVRWTPRAGSLYRVRFTVGAGAGDSLPVSRVDVITATPAAVFPALLPGSTFGTCATRPCSVAIETYGGLPSTDEATNGTAIRDVLRGARSGSVTAGPATRFSN